MKIGILTSGGDCPGLNAVIRGVVLKGTTNYNIEFVGIRDGWRGVVDDLTNPNALGQLAGTAHRRRLENHLLGTVGLAIG